MKLGEATAAAHREVRVESERLHGCTGDALVAALVRELLTTRQQLRDTRVRLGEATDRIGTLRREKNRLAALLVHVGLVDEVAS